MNFSYNIKNNENKKVKKQILFFFKYHKFQITVSHYFSIKKAKESLDYQPDIRSDDWDEIINALKQEKRKEKRNKSFDPKICFVLLSGLYFIINVLCTSKFYNIAFA